MLRPILSRTVLLAPMTDRYVAFDTKSKCLHELNATAALLVELCDGTRSPDDVVALAAPLLPPDSEDAVYAWLEEARQQQLLVEQDLQDEVASELSAGDLSSLASQLRDEGLIRGAFLCQQAAAELTPDDTAIQRDFGELSHIVGKRDLARQAYERYITLQPDDAEVRHLLTSLRDDATPTRVPDACIQQLYQRFSGFYEDNMCDELGYEGPEHLVAAIDAVMGDRRDLSILDLGCGTGLAGARLRDRASRLVGIDLSPEMLEQARSRNIYDELEVGELTAWLNQTTEKFDLIVACDTFIYLGDLQQVAVPASRLLSPDGVIAFSVEAAEEPPFRLTDSGRYVHHRSHIESVSDSVGLESAITPAFLRMEYGKEVTALYVTLS